MTCQVLMPAMSFAILITWKALASHFKQYAGV